jgi:hypothetical protein
MISTARRRSSIGASGSSIITAVKPIAKVMFKPCDRMVVDHLSIEVETGHNDYSILLNRSQHYETILLRNSPQQVHKLRNRAQQDANLHKETKQVRNRSQGGETDAQRYS